MRQPRLVDLDGRSVPFSLVPIGHGISQVPLLALRRPFARLPREITPGPHLRRAVVAHHVFARNSQRDGPVRFYPFEFSRDSMPPPAAGLGAVLLELEPDRWGWGLGRVYRTARTRSRAAAARRAATARRATARRRGGRRRRALVIALDVLLRPAGAQLDAAAPGAQLDA